MHALSLRQALLTGPQYAYGKEGRRIRDAVNRALTHIDEVKAIREHSQRKLSQAREGGARVQPGRPYVT